MSPWRPSPSVEASFARWAALALALAAGAILLLAPGSNVVVVLAVLGALYAAAVLGVRRLVRDLRARVEETEHLALHDGLTNLPNRLLFEDRAAHALRVARREGGKVAVMLLDLDRFKEINDTLGHRKGDQLLGEVAARLSRALRASDTLARLGGDEFGLVVPVSDIGDAQRVARRLLAQIEQPVAVDDLNLRVGASVGIALYPEDGLETETLVRKADVAMYAGKQIHLPVHYSPEHDHYSPERLMLIGELKRAIEEDELVVHYQPVVDVRSGATRGLEALVRWQHPQRGLIAPADFVGFAEQTGLMEELTQAVLRLALPELARWHRAGHEVILAVNVSGRDLGDRTFPARLAQLLEDSGVEAHSLELEIAEETVLADPSRTLIVLDRLRETGVRIAIDNFGAGKTSLHYLRKLRVDTLKIDRSFIGRVLDDQPCDAIVRSTIELAHRLGLTVVAEGVETTETLGLLAGYGCELAQGHLFSRPAPASELRFTTPAAQLIALPRRHP